MRVEFNFSEVMEKLDYITSIVEDNADDSMKNVTFYISENKVKIIGHNNFAICKYALEDTIIQNAKEDETFIQIRAKEFSGLLKTLSNMRRTRVDRIYFETLDRKVRLTIEEDALSEDLEFAQYLKQKSSWLFDSIRIKEDILKEIRQDISDISLESIVSKDIRLYIDTLGPLLSSEITSNSSKLYFSSDFAYVVPKIYATLFENNLRDEFKNLVLSSHAVKFLSKVLVGNELVDLGRNEKYIIIKSDNFEVYLRYQTSLLPVDRYLNSIAIKEGESSRQYVRSVDAAEKLSFINRENGIVLDKIYLQDVLKRFSLVDDQMIIVIDTEKKIINLSNKKFNLDIPLIMVKGMKGYGEIKFRMPPDKFRETLLGGDDLFTPEMFMYFIQNSRGGYNIANMDSTGSWFSILQI